MKTQWLNYIGLTLILVVFWVAVSGSLHWPQLMVGLAAAAFVVFFNRSLIIAPEDRPPVRIKTVIWLFGYLVKLIIDIVKANFQVAWLVLHPKMPIEPNMVELEVDIKRPASRVLLGNSITLTPGTLTVLADDDRFYIHALTIKNGKALKDWPLIERLKHMEDE